MEQYGIALFGVMGIWLSQAKTHHMRKWACISGLIGQPFWFYAAYTNEQWGIFILCFFYTYAWLTGLYNNWIKKQQTDDQ